MPDQSQIVLVITMALALLYAYGNGLNDAANALATVVSTRVLSPTSAVIMGGCLNLVGALSGSAVAKTIGKGIVDPDFMTQAAVMAAILSAVIWVLVATRWGFPVSVSHSLVAGVLGSGIAVAGLDKVNGAIMTKVITALAFSPLLGFAGAFVLMLVLYWTLQGLSMSTVNKAFSKFQILSAALLAYSHGKNDAQNAMGIMALAWAVYYSAGQNVEVLLWMKFASGLTMALGVAVGGWKVIRTLGMKITSLTPASGFAANIAAAGVIEAASNIGLPVSTTHTASSAIAGVGATRGFGAVSLSVLRGIFAAWLITYPFCLGLGWLLAKLLTMVL